jgi:phage terminase large subunit-like protein
MAVRITAERYMKDVLAGRIPVSKLVHLQIERHYNDLKTGKSRGLKFDKEAARAVIEFFPLFLVGTDGDWDGVPIELPPWWQALLWILYGWKRKNDKGKWVRRFKFAYTEVGRGNLKSLVASGLCLYELYAFGEPGAQVYAAATDRKTAKLVFDTASLMVRKSEWLSKHIDVSRENLCIPGTASKFEPCASEDQNLMGLRPTFVCIDELHVHTTSGVWDVFYSAMGKRKQPLMFTITNSGQNQNSVCFRKREYSEKVLKGIVPDDRWFAWVCGIDDEGRSDFNWEDESNWIKANPCLGGAVSLAELREQAQVAKADPSSLANFLRFRLCVWTTSYSVWMPMDKWDACKRVVDRESLRGRRAVGSLDLSTTTDISCFLLLFEPTEDDPYYRAFPQFFLPRENLERRVKRDRVPYDVWERQGLFHLTEGPVIDYRYIRKTINDLREEFRFDRIAFDRWNSTEIVTNLGDTDGFEMVEMGQGFASMNAPTKRLMEMVLSGEVAHDGNPVLRWMASNVIAAKDPAGNIKPDKAKSREKIDGIVALIMAIFVALGTTDDSDSGFEPYYL